MAQPHASTVDDDTSDDKASDAGSQASGHTFKVKVQNSDNTTLSCKSALNRMNTNLFTRNHHAAFLQLHSDLMVLVDFLIRDSSRGPTLSVDKYQRARVSLG